MNQKYITMKIMMLRNEKQKYSKKKLCDRKKFLKENKSKFDLNSEDDTNNSDDDNFTNFDKYDLDPDKSLAFQAVILRKKFDNFIQL